MPDHDRVGVKPGLPPWGPHVRFRRVQTLVREGSPFVKPLVRHWYVALRAVHRMPVACGAGCKARTRTDEGAILP